MKKSLIALSIMFAATLAVATPKEVGNVSSSVATGVGVGIGHGGSGGSGGQGGSGGNASAVGGVAAGGNSSAQAVNGGVNVNSLYERAAPSVGLSSVPQPITSCRLSIGGGGSNSSGAIVGGIPIGNDQTCLVGAALSAMSLAGGFTRQDAQRIACKIEGMSELATCKALPAVVERSETDLKLLP